jgi:ethanolamine ammonia-lyase small subunit
MVSEIEIKQMVRQILSEMSGRDGAALQPVSSVEEPSPSVGEDALPDLADPGAEERCLVPEPADGEALAAMKRSTPARIGVWRTGPRYLTETLLRFRADHAVAQDAVFSDVPDDFLAANGLETIRTECADRDQFLTRPDLGRQFGAEAKESIRRIAGTPPIDRGPANANGAGKEPGRSLSANASGAKVLLYLSDGLSSAAVEANGMDTLKTIGQGLERRGVKPAKPFFVKYGRVPAMDVVSEITGAEVVCLLIGERPGLVTAESMSAYLTYRGTVGMPEARRTVVSNIHAGGTPAVEAGAYIADIIALMLEKKVSGIDLKL